MIDIYKTACVLFFALFVSCKQGGNIDSMVDTSHIITTDISNQQISSFAEDSFGHIWIGTFRGLNKYNAHEFHQYFYNGDSLGLPNNQIKTIFCDSKKRLWIGTVNGVSLYTEEDCFQQIPNDERTQYVIQFLENREGRIFLRSGAGISVFVPEENRFVLAFPDLTDRNMFVLGGHLDSGNNLWIVNPFLIRCYNSSTLELKQSFETKERFIHYSFLRDNGELWLAYSDKMTILDTHTGLFKDIPEPILKHRGISNAIITYIHPYGNTSLLINTNIGLFLYDFAENTVIHQEESGFPFKIPKHNITTMFTDSQKNLWIGTFDQGFVTCYNYKERFNKNNYLSAYTDHISILSIKKDKSKNIWMTSSTNGMFVYNTEKSIIQPVETKQFFSESSIFFNKVRYLFIDNDNYIWLIADAKLIRCRYNAENNKLLMVEEFFVPTIISNMTEDRNGTIWASGGGENIYVLRRGSKDFETFRLFPQEFTFTNALITLSTGEILVAAHPFNPVMIHPDTREMKEINISSVITSKFVPACLFEDSKGDIWIGTIMDGLLYHSRSTGIIKKMEGLPCTDISDIQEDVHGNIWVSTLYGFSKYDHTTGKFTNYYKSDGIGGNQFNERSSCRSDNGILLFGGTHGLTVFNPIDVTFKRNIPLLFEDLKIHNQIIRPFKSDCIDKHLKYNPLIHLQHDQNSFTISFAALDYSEFERVHYSYIMEGFDKIWLEAQNNREAYYSNLPPGEYTFRVRITNNDKSIVEAENAIPIIIKAAPWASWWAYYIYILLSAVIIGIIFRMFNHIRSKNRQVAAAELEKEQERRLNKMNMNYFANISHEFRTPLTMISGPITQLCEKQDITGENKQLLYIIQRSVKRMLKLVNQLMDFNKLENDSLKLSVKRTDIIFELNRFVEVFRVNMQNKDIKLQIYGLEDTYLTWLDVDKLDKVIGNLMTNALKFTDKGGRIKLSFDVINRDKAAELFHLTDKDVSAEYIKIAVTDSGYGIPQNELERIFERYYQLNNQTTGKYNWGTGIGLYYTRCLVELHHGYIKADSQIGEGSTFTCIIPVDDNAYKESERQSLTDTQEDIFPILTAEQYKPLNREAVEEDKINTIMVVEDDTEVAHYIKTLLSPIYKVVCRFSADSAYKTLKEDAPDIILSDVVMPGTDGYQFCRLIKEDIQLSHIPVILVTAKTSVKNQVEGLDTGADAYVTKPFDPTYLLALINSLITNREKLRSLLGTTTKTDKIEQNMLSPQDNAFMTNLYHLMEQELSNPELNISGMTEVLKISRTKFYYKVKGLTGENPNTFFKKYKLNRAAELLVEGKYNISEIADMTGFSTISHFSASFKKRFGASPSKYQLE